ncbi:MAG: hydratase, partial [Clostridia bacterium]|nr:hydratase [Clostridia bacterium]
LTGEYAEAVKKAGVELKGSVSVGSGVYAVKPGDGSAREQAASCQRVLGGVCNIAKEYATKRYRSNLINWGMLPFLSDEEYKTDDIVIVYDVKSVVDNGGNEFKAKIVRGDKVIDTVLKVDALTDDERDIISKGCLINYYKAHK